MLESMVESGVKSTIKQGGIKVTKKMTQKELINLIGHEPVKRMSRLMNMRNLREATDIVAHNPSKENIWKALADCSDLEKSGGNVKSFIRSSVEMEDGYTDINGRALETMYRYARRYGLTSEENLALMRQGKAPFFPNDGGVAHLDHIIPVKYAPELKTLPANLRILSASENTSRQAAIDNHCRNKVRELIEKIGNDWKPGEVLQQELSR